MEESKKETGPAKGRWMFYGLIFAAAAMAFLIIALERGKEPYTPLDPPTLSIEAMRASPGSNCAEVHSGAAKSVSEPLKDGARAPCGLTFIVDAGKTPQYVVLQLDTSAGTFMENTGRPKNLDGTRSFSGKIAWSVNLPEPLKAALNIHATVLSSDRIVKMDLNWLKARAYRSAAVTFLEQRGFTVLRKKITINP